MINHHPTENGFTFIGTIITIIIFTLFTLIAYQGLQMINGYLRRSSLLRIAVVEGVNSLEMIKINKNYSDLHELTIQKENVEVYHRVTKFNPDLYRIFIEVRDLTHNAIFTLETLAER